MNQKINRSLVGSLLYLAKQTWPRHVYSQIAFQTHESIYQLTPAVRKTTYARSSRYKRLKTCTKEASYCLVGESDADWSGDVNDRKSTTGF